MPSSPFVAYSGLGVMAAISLIALAASFLTLIASAWLLWRYRHAVARLMSAQAGDTGHRPVGSAQIERESALPLAGSAAIAADPVSGSREHPAADRLYRQAVSEPRRHACIHAVAGALFALLVGLAAFLAFSQAEVNYLRAAAHPLQFLFMVWTVAWPIVLTTNIVAAAGRWNRWLNISIYGVLLVAVGALVALIPSEASIQAGTVSLPAWSGETPIRLVAKWSVFNLAPTLLTVTFRNRRVRAVAPLVLSFMTVVAAGVLGIIAAAFIYEDISVTAVDWAAGTFGLSAFAALIGYLLLLCAIACFLFGVVGWRLLVWMRNGYQRKTVSDQSLAIDAIWLIFGSFDAVILAMAGPGWALSALVAFVVLKTAIRTGDTWLRSTRSRRQPRPTLLVLRVFALGKRSERLFDAVTRHWRYLGDVRLIAGTDLALSTVAPHQFMAFVSGRLTQLFVRSEAAIDRSLADLDSERDADGRFRINDFFCSADMWQSVLTRLITSTDVVLMDLRSLTEHNAGCVFEIKELLNVMPLDRLVVVVDETTDRRFLQHIVEGVCRDLRAGSPNSGLTASALHPFELDALGNSEIQGLLRRLCAAVN